MRFPSPLLAFEILSLLTFLGLVVQRIIKERSEGEMIPLSAEALVTGSGQERWSGIFFEDQHVGFTVTRTSPTRDGNLYEQRSRYRLVSFGQIQDVVTASAALTDGEGKLSRFDFFMVAGEIRLAVRGEVRGDRIVMELDQAGETRTLEFPIDEAPHVGASLEEAIRRTPLAVGKRFTIPFFNPSLFSQGEMQFQVESVEVLDNGEEAFWLRGSMEGMEFRALALPTGEILREEGMLGMNTVRMPAAEAQDIPASQQGADLIGLSAVQLHGRLPGNDARALKQLTLHILGVDPERIRDEPPLQDREGERVTIAVPSLEALPALPVRDPDGEAWLLDTATLPSAHPDIVRRAREVVGDAPDRLTAVKRLNAFVFDYVEKVPTISVPNGLEVLRTAQGDCNEHTALFVSLARAVGIPARIAAGVVYSDRIGPKGAFYYHAWPEVRLGGPTEWVPVDPTFGQVPADATHVKLVEGDLERQVEIMGVMGRLSFRLVTAE